MGVLERGVDAAGARRRCSSTSSSSASTSLARTAGSEGLRDVRGMEHRAQLPNAAQGAISAEIRSRRQLARLPKWHGLNVTGCTPLTGRPEWLSPDHPEHSTDTLDHRPDERVCGR
eukprot:5290188-Prymnesium_polylepis.1